MCKNGNKIHLFQIHHIFKIEKDVTLALTGVGKEVQTAASTFCKLCVERISMRLTSTCAESQCHFFESLIFQGNCSCFNLNIFSETLKILKRTTTLSVFKKWRMIPRKAWWSILFPFIPSFLLLSHSQTPASSDVLRPRSLLLISGMAELLRGRAWSPFDFPAARSCGPSCYSLSICKTVTVCSRVTSLPEFETMR